MTWPVRTAAWGLLPSLLWLALLLLLPLLYILRLSFSADPFALTASGWSLSSYAEGLPFYWSNLKNSLLIGLSATVLAFLLGLPVAYGIAFYARRFKSLLLFAFFAPFLTSYLIRMIAWQTLLGANGPLFAPLHAITGVELRVLGTPFAVVAGLAYQLVPFVLLPLFIAFNRIDRNLCAAADDLYGGRCGLRGALFGALAGLAIGGLLGATLFDTFFSRSALLLVFVLMLSAVIIGACMTERFVLIIFPLSRSGFIAAAILSFIPALGDYVNAALLGDIRSQMLGNVIAAKFLQELDYAGAAALSACLLVVAMLLLSLLLRLLRGMELLDVV